MFVVDIARHGCALCSLFTRGDDNTRKLFARVSRKYGGVNKWIANDQTVTTPFNQLCLLPSSGIATIFFKGMTVAHILFKGGKRHKLYKNHHNLYLRLLRRSSSSHCDRLPRGLFVVVIFTISSILQGVFLRLYHIC